MNGSLQSQVSHLLSWESSYLNLFWSGCLMAYVLVVCALAVLPLIRSWSPGILGEEAPAVRLPDWLLSPWLFWGFTLVGICLLWIPAFGIWEANVDEGLWIAGARTLGEDARYWHSVDGTTAGPLAIYPLMVFPALGLGLGYGEVRLWTLAIALFSILLLHGVFRQLFPANLARVLVLPFVILQASMNHRELVAYNAEQFPLLFLALALWLIVLGLRGTACRSLLCLGLAGFALGLLPYAKLQSVPIGLVLAAMAGGWLLWRRRWLPLGVLVAGGILPSLLVVVYLSATGLWEHFWISYIESNLNFADKGFTGTQISIFYAFYRLVRKSLQTAFMFPWSVAFYVSLVPLLWLAWRQRKLWVSTHGFWLALATLAWLAALYANLKPSSHHWHHFLLLMMPSALVIGMLFGIALHRPAEDKPTRTGLLGRLLLVSGFVLLFGIIPGAFLAGQGNFGIQHAKKFAARADHPSPAAAAIRELSQPGDRLGFWGFQHNIYVDTGLPQGSREGMTQFQIQIDEFSLPHREYYFDRYVQDLEANQPRLFVDTVGPEDDFYNEPQYRHENYPLVRDYVSEHYELVREEPSFRLYLRKERQADSRLLDSPQ